MPETKRPLKVFLCHAHADRETVRALYARLKREGVDVWLDKEKLLPGADWELEIRQAVHESDVVVVCLSKQFNQAGFRQKEVRIALDTAMEKPEGEIFIIPARLEECESPESLSKWHWVDLFENNGFQRLIRALRTRAEKIGATLRIRKGGQSKTSHLQDKKLEKTTELPVSNTDSGKIANSDIREAQSLESTEYEIAEKAAWEKLEREVVEKEALEKKEKAEQAEQDRIALEEKARKEADEKARLEAEERSQRENEEQERKAAEAKAQKAVQEKTLQEAEERALAEKKEQERKAAEIAAQEKEKREIAEQARREKIEGEAADKAAREKAKRDTVEIAKRERAERRVTQIAALKETFSRFLNSFRLALPKVMPLLRIGAIIGFAFVVLWFGSSATFWFLSLMPTEIVPATLRPNVTGTLTTQPATPSQTAIAPTSTKTEIPTLTPTLTPIPPQSILFQKDFEDGLMGEWQQIDEAGGIWTVEQEPDGNHYLCGTGPSINPPQIWYRDRRILWTDYEFETRVKFIKGHTLFILFRIDLASNGHYGVAFNGGFGLMQTWKGISGSIPIMPYPGGWYTIRMAIKGHLFNARIESTYLDTPLYQESTLKSLVSDHGGIGYVIGNEDKVCFDDIKVWSIK